MKFQFIAILLVLLASVSAVPVRTPKQLEEDRRMRIAYHRSQHSQFSDRVNQNDPGVSSQSSVDSTTQFNGPMPYENPSHSDYESLRALHESMNAPRADHETQTSVEQVYGGTQNDESIPYPFEDPTHPDYHSLRALHGSMYGPSVDHETQTSNNRYDGNERESLSSLSGTTRDDPETNPDADLNANELLNDVSPSHSSNLNSGVNNAELNSLDSGSDSEDSVLNNFVAGRQRNRGDIYNDGYITQESDDESPSHQHHSFGALNAHHVLGGGNEIQSHSPPNLGPQHFGALTADRGLDSAAAPGNNEYPDLLDLSADELSPEEDQLSHESDHTSSNESSSAEDQFPEESHGFNYEREPVGNDQSNYRPNHEQHSQMMNEFRNRFSENHEPHFHNTVSNDQDVAEDSASSDAFSSNSDVSEVPRDFEWSGHTSGNNENVRELGKSGGRNAIDDAFDNFEQLNSENNGAQMDSLVSSGANIEDGHSFREPRYYNVEDHQVPSDEMLSNMFDPEQESDISNDQQISASEEPSTMFGPEQVQNFLDQPSTISSEAFDEADHVNIPSEPDFSDSNTEAPLHSSKKKHVRFQGEDTLIQPSTIQTDSFAETDRPQSPDVPEFGVTNTQDPIPQLSDKPKSGLRRRYLPHFRRKNRHSIVKAPPPRSSQSYNEGHVFPDSPSAQNRQNVENMQNMDFGISSDESSLD